MDGLPFSLAEAAVHAHLLHSSEPSESISVHGYVSTKTRILKTEMLGYMEEQAMDATPTKPILEECSGWL